MVLRSSMWVFLSLTRCSCALCAFCGTRKAYNPSESCQPQHVLKVLYISGYPEKMGGASTILEMQGGLFIRCINMVTEKYKAEKDGGKTRRSLMDDENDFNMIDREIEDDMDDHGQMAQLLLENSFRHITNSMNNCRNDLKWDWIFKWADDMLHMKWKYEMEEPYGEPEKEPYGEPEKEPYGEPEKEPYGEPEKEPYPENEPKPGIYGMGKGLRGKHIPKGNMFERMLQEDDFLTMSPSTADKNKLS